MLKLTLSFDSHTAAIESSACSLAVARRLLRQTANAMSVRIVLESQHGKVDARFVALSLAVLNGVGVDTLALVTDLACYLTAHMAVEEELLYPIVGGAKRDTVLTNCDEHALLAFGLTRLMTADIRHASFTEKVTAVRELFDCHAADEERDLSASVTSALGYGESRALARKLDLRFEELLAMGYPACRYAAGRDARIASRLVHV